MAKKELTKEEKLEIYNKEHSKLVEKRDKRLQYLAEKRARLEKKLNKRFADDPEKLEEELGIMHIDNDVWIDIAHAQFEDKAKTLEIKYLK